MRFPKVSVLTEVRETGASVARNYRVLECTDVKESSLYVESLVRSRVP